MEMRVNSGTLTDYLQISDLANHGICVHLAHVIAPIVLLGLANVKKPCVGIIVRYAVPRDA